MSVGKLKSGQRGELEVEVTQELTVNRMGREGADVLSTPGLLMLMERACIVASEPHMLAATTTVGYAVDGLRHMAPTSIGRRVRVTAVLEEVDRNRLTYSIEAFEGDKKIGVAMHKRAVISTRPGL